MKVITSKLGATVDEAHIYCLADLHIGSPKCKVSVIQDVIKTIKEDPNGYCILLGDLINNTTKTSVGDVYSEELSPMEQIKYVTELFRPIKDRILAVTQGNHEGRTYKQDGIDLTYFFCSELGIVDKYDFASCVLLTKFGHNTRKSNRGADKATFTYSLYLTHGAGGGRTPGAKANAIDRAAQVVNTDITVIGHQHTPMMYMDAHYELKAHGIPTVNLCEHMNVMCSAFLDYEVYAEKNNMKPSPIAVPMIVLNGTGNKKQMCCIIKTI